MTPPNIGFCARCGKWTWPSRRVARKARRVYHPGEHLNAYPCPTGRGFHLGHLPAAVLWGKAGRDALGSRRAAS